MFNSFLKNTSCLFPGTFIPYTFELHTVKPGSANLLKIITGVDECIDMYTSQFHL